MKTSALILGVLSVLSFAACTVQPDNNQPNTNTASQTGLINQNTNTPQPQASPSPVPSPTATPLPATLATVDAFMGQEDFVADLKLKLSLTDDQIERLRRTARDATLKLSESSPTGGAGTSKDARERADHAISEVIGHDKAQQLYVLIQQRGGEQAVQKPNAVPTDSRLVVNIPAYRMDLYQNGTLTKTYRIGIGYPEFPLPTGMRKADTIIFNPTWTPPDEPWVESSNKVHPGEKIAAGDKLNPLGPAKIPIGLPNLIHGGKQPAKIGGFASHGCVGLTTPQLNEFLPLFASLGASSVTPDEVAKYEKQKTETKSVKLSQIIPVELRYETIVVEDGKLHIYRDVYDRNTNNDDNLRQVLAVYGVTIDQLSDTEKSQIEDAMDAMSRDANGRQEPDSKTVAKKSKAEKKSAKVTYSFKGAKVAVINIAALAGKGYPDPVQLNTGGSPNLSTTNASKAPKTTTKKSG